MCVMQGFTPNAYLRGDVRDTQSKPKTRNPKLTTQTYRYTSSVAFGAVLWQRAGLLQGSDLLCIVLRQHGCHHEPAFLILVR